MIHIGKHKKLTQTDRELLSQWLKGGVSKKECARRLGRDIKTIRRELKRNCYRVNIGDNYWEKIYEPVHAHTVSEERKRNAWNAREPLKNKKIYRYVLKKLRKGWSPEQIAGRLKQVDHKDDPTWHICHETIYAFIYKEKTDATKEGLHKSSILDKRLKNRQKRLITVTDKMPLYEYLRRKQIKRRIRSGRKVHRARIPDRISIHDRPKEIETRIQFGHWEGDSIVGLGHRNGLHTEYERVCSLTRFERLNRITAGETAHAARKIFSPLPPYAKRSTTLDNGSENTLHKSFGIQAYFADPYSAWQRGGNENCNMWIRYYFPKGTDFSKITDEELRDVEWELNNRPRKRLNYRTPQEVFTEYLKMA